MGIHSTTWYRPRVKFCGLTRSEDVDAACEIGVDLIGLVQVPASKRFVDLSQSQRLVERVNGRARVVLLFMDADEPTVRRTVESVQPDMLQFHGGESGAFCQQFGLPWIKALATGGRQLEDVNAQARSFGGAHYLLLDGHAPGQMGGSGHSVDGSAAHLSWPAPLMLAGGLSPDTVGEAIHAWRPQAVDVSSGIEAAPGQKDKDRMQAFTQAVADAAAAINSRGDHD